jgi:hypothetical protein
LGRRPLVIGIHLEKSSIFSVLLTEGSRTQVGFPFEETSKIRRIFEIQAIADFDDGQKIFAWASFKTPSDVYRYRAFLPSSSYVVPVALPPLYEGWRFC